MSARLTLSPDEVVELSGLLQPAAQIRWLSRVGIPHFVGADGRPRVVRELFDTITREIDQAVRSAC